MHPLLSAVVATHDRPDLLQGLLGDLAKQDLSHEKFEILLCDDGSSQPVQPLVEVMQTQEKRLAALQIRVQRGPQAGPAAARNRVLNLVRGEWVLFLNDDVRIAPDLLKKHLQMQQAKPRALMGRFVFPPELRADLFHRVVEDLGLIGTRCMRPARPLPPLYFWTGNLSLPTWAWREVGGFDPGFAEPKGEDVDLGYRLRRDCRRGGRGLELILSNRLQAWHHHPMTPESWALRSAQVGRAQARLASLHPDPALWPGGQRLQQVDDHRAAWARLVSQTEAVKSLRLWTDRLVTRDDPATLGEQWVQSLGRHFRLPADNAALLAASVAATSLWDFQNSFWQEILQG